MKTTPHPDWALAHKRKGTELRLISGKYYLYEVTSKWNPEKKRSVKITGKLLGKITEANGFVESDKARLRERQPQIERVQVKEYGITATIGALCGDTIDALRKHFPDSWERLICLAYGRLAYRSPLGNMAFHYYNSYLSQQYPGIDLSIESISCFLRELGGAPGWIANSCRLLEMPVDRAAPHKIFVGHKARGNAETMADALKSIAEADRAYMQDKQVLEGWTFINQIALKWYSAILNLTNKHGLDKKYSPADLLLFLSEIKKVRINDRWHDAEAAESALEVMQKMNILRQPPIR